MADLTQDELIDAAISEAISGPQKASGDAGSVESYSLKELIEMSNYIKGQKAGVKRNRGLRFTRFSPDGTTGGPLR